MRGKKLLKRVGLPVLVIILALASLACLRKIRTVRWQYEHHPEPFRTAGEFFCTLDIESYPLLISRPNLWANEQLEDKLPDTQWPETVIAAIDDIFRRTDCPYIYVSTIGWDGDEVFCQFPDASRAHDETETGIAFSLGQLPENEVTDGYTRQWIELSHKWFFYERISPWGLKKSPG